MVVLLKKELEMLTHTDNEIHSVLKLINLVGVWLPDQRMENTLCCVFIDFKYDGL